MTPCPLTYKNVKNFIDTYNVLEKRRLEWQDGRNLDNVALLCGCDGELASISPVFRFLPVK